MTLQLQLHLVSFLLDFSQGATCSTANHIFVFTLSWVIINQGDRFIFTNDSTAMMAVENL